MDAIAVHQADVLDVIADIIYQEVIVILVLADVQVVHPAVIVQDVHQVY